MKKLIILGLAGLLILAFSGTALSQAKAPVLEFKASGFIDAHTVLSRNVNVQPGERSTYFYGPGWPSVLLPQTGTDESPPGYAFDKKRAYVETRARLRFDAIMEKNLSGTIWFEIDSTKWGEETGTSGKAGYWGTDRTAVEVKNVFITFGVPWVPVPTTLQVGLTTQSYRSSYLVSTDGAGVIADIKIDPARIKLTWFKPVENEDFASDDVDTYGIDASFKAGPMTFGGFALHYNFNTYTTTAITSTSPGSSVDYRGNITWLGLYTDGKLGPVNLIFDFCYDTGKIEDHRNLAAASRARNVKYRGWISILQMDYPWEKFNFGLQGLYASGADTEKTSGTGLPGSTTSSGVASTKVGMFVNPPAAEMGIKDLGLVYYNSGAAGLGRSTTGMLGGNPTDSTMLCRKFGGSWAAKLYGSYKVTPDYKVTLQGLYIGDTTKHGNTIGTARSYPYGTANLRDDKTIGWELDLINEVSLYKSLLFRFGGGILFAGDAMDFYVSSTKPDLSPKNPWVVITQLTYTF